MLAGVVFVPLERLLTLHRHEAVLWKWWVTSVAYPFRTGFGGYSQVGRDAHGGEAESRHSNSGRAPSIIVGQLWSLTSNTSAHEEAAHGLGLAVA